MSDVVVVPLELAEIGAFVDLYRSASPEVVGQCGVTLKELDEGVVLAATGLDVLALNRVLGLGLTGRPGDAALAQAVEAFETIGSARFFVQVAPTGWSAEISSPWRTRTTRRSPQARCSLPGRRPGWGSQ